MSSLRLPLAFPVLLGPIALALLLVLLGTSQASESLTKAGGYVVLTFAALGDYLFLDATSTSTGGKALPLGQPLVK